MILFDIFYSLRRERYFQHSKCCISLMNCPIQYSESSIALKSIFGRKLGNMSFPIAVFMWLLGMPQMAFMLVPASRWGKHSGTWKLRDASNHGDPRGVIVLSQGVTRSKPWKNVAALHFCSLASESMLQLSFSCSLSSRSMLQLLFPLPTAWWAGQEHHNSFIPTTCMSVSFRFLSHNWEE